MKQRLDLLLTEKGYFPSREKAKTSIMAGLVFIDDAISDKPGTMVDVDSKIFVKGSQCPYVSRGGFKLEKALKVFNLDVTNLICLDIGASTGGFTDCMLQNGAKKVYSVDVGYGQLDYKLRKDPRVICMEKTNFRYMTSDQIPEKIDFACTDVSFISLKHMFPTTALLIKEHSHMACLIKPQFEAGKEQVGKKGIIKDKAIHKQVILNVIDYAHDSNFSVKGLDFSPVTGATGNIEFIIDLEYTPDLINDDYFDIDRVINLAHQTLEG